MQKYIVTARSVSLNSGILSLNNDQALRREHMIQSLQEDGMYRIMQPVVFKNGETIGYNGEVNKLLLKAIEKVKRGRPKK